MTARVQCVLTVLLSGLVACATHAPSRSIRSAPAAAVQTSARVDPYVAACIATEIATAAIAEANAWERVRLQTLNRSITAGERARDLSHFSAQANLSVFVEPGSPVPSILPRNPSRQSAVNDQAFRALAASIAAERTMSAEDKREILVATSAAVASEYAELARANEKAFLLQLARGSGVDGNGLGEASERRVRSAPDLEAFYSFQFRRAYDDPSPRCRAKAAS
ncbi:MAG: hypothetical protein H7Z74_11955 [Anaerolineae bacterium]|nr:hypothetical protein [Gemmatimonadaceae bacterium]